MREFYKDIQFNIMKTKDRNQLCYNASDKIITILEELGYTTERKPNYSDELKDLITIEIRRTIEKDIENFTAS